jgi:hypothetical protein
MDRGTRGLALGTLGVAVALAALVLTFAPFGYGPWELGAAMGAVVLVALLETVLDDAKF